MPFSHRKALSKEEVKQESLYSKAKSEFDQETDLPPSSQMSDLEIRASQGNVYGAETACEAYS